MDYSTYQDLGGTASESEFNVLYPMTEELLLSYVARFVPCWRMKDRLEDMIDADRILLWQMNFVVANGGVSMMSTGRSDLDVKQVQTQGFTYQMDSGSHLEYFSGIAIAPLVATSIERQLRMKGYLNRSLC